MIQMKGDKRQETFDMRRETDTGDRRSETRDVKQETFAFRKKV